VNGKPIFDLLGRDYTLLCFSTSEQANDDVADWEKTAADIGVPLAILHCDSAPARALYGADRVLIRPDHHVAWRGGANAAAEDILAMVCARIAQPVQ
jgi:hypothetical protein